MPRYTSDGSVTFVEKRRKDGKARGVMYRRTTNNYTTSLSSLSLEHSQNADCSLEPTNSNTLDLK